MAHFIQRQAITGSDVDYFINCTQGNKMSDIGMKIS